MRGFIHHLFVPRESNNFRAKLLHNSNLLFIIAFLLVAQLLLVTIGENSPSVLGTSVHINTEELLILTNKVRVAHNLSPLVLNNDLGKAAELKAENMFAQNYWAHTSPNGTTPWYFFKQAGYTYTYAGENLARGFTKSEDIVNAWMASPTHRENMLSSNYTEIGFAIEEGELLSEDTTLVVEHFGNRETTPGDSIVVQTAGLQEPSRQTVVAAINTDSIVEKTALSKNLAVILLSFLILGFIVDMIVVKRKRIIRFVGHNIDHLFFLGSILILVLILGKGIVI